MPSERPKFRVQGGEFRKREKVAVKSDITLMKLFLLTKKVQSHFCLDASSKKFVYTAFSRSNLPRVSLVFSEEHILSAFLG